MNDSSLMILEVSVCAFEALKHFILSQKSSTTLVHNILSPTPYFPFHLMPPFVTIQQMKPPTNTELLYEHS